MNDESVVLYGAGSGGDELLKDTSEKGFMHKISAIIDRKADSIKCLYGIKVRDLDYLNNLDVNDIIVITLRDLYEAQKVVIFLLKKKFTNIYLYDFNTYFGVFDTKGDLSCGLFMYSERKPILDYLEFHVIDNCNLNCRSCAHLSNTYKEKSFQNIEKYESNLKKIADLFSNIRIIRILGGEPLLNPELHKWIVMTRKYYPYSEIAIVTNGLLVKTMSQLLINTVKANNVKLHITWYPPIDSNCKSIVDFLNRNSIMYNFSKRVDQFGKGLSREESDYQCNYTKISTEDSMCTCHHIRGDRLFLCSLIPYVYEKRDFLGIKISEEDYKNSSIMIDDIEDVWKVIDKINSPVPMCKMCVPRVYQKWEGNCTRSMTTDDWFV